MANTYATWNPSDKSVNISLSGGNLVATCTLGTGVTSSSVRSTISKTSGKWYWENTITTIETPHYDTVIGIADSTWDVSLDNGFADDHCWAYGRDGGSLYRNSNGTVTSNQSNLFVANDVLSVAWDADGNTMDFRLNNTLVTLGSGNIASVGNPAFAMLNLFYNNVVTTNFGATALTYTPPVGYNSGLYDAAAAATPRLRSLLGVGL